MRCPPAVEAAVVNKNSIAVRRSVRASASRATCAAPARFNTRAHALAVAPVVTTSSTSSTRIPSSGRPRAIWKRSAACCAAFRIGKPGLRTRGFLPANHIPHRNIPLLPDFPRQKIGLIESALPLLEPVQRHRNDHVEARLARQRLRQKPSKGPRQRPHATVLEQMNQLPQRAFIGSVGIHRIEALQSQPAQRAAAGFIQRKAIDERHPAGHAEIFRDQRHGFRQAARKPEFWKTLEGVRRRRGNRRERQCGKRR